MLAVGLDITEQKSLAERSVEADLRLRDAVDNLTAMNSQPLRVVLVQSPEARDRLVSVMVSITSLDNDIKRTLEPRTASPPSTGLPESALEA